ncbi:MAG TPA: class I SAM-dependent methyltransferase [Candidatus Dormibacteraeota bacterium]
MRFDVFETVYGELYDAGVQSRLAPLGGFLLWGADVERFLAAMATGVACRKGQLVVDCPTGGGVTFARGLPDTKGRLLGVDLSRLMLTRARARAEALPAAQRRHLDLARGDATRLPLADASADRVLCFNSLHCIPAHRVVLREFRRVLKPGGELVGTTLVADAPLPWQLNVQAARLSGFFVPPHSRRLRADARAAGFRHWNTERTGALLFFQGHN